MAQRSNALGSYEPSKSRTASCYRRKRGSLLMQTFADAVAIIKAEIADFDNNPLRLQSQEARWIYVGLKRALEALTK